MFLWFNPVKKEHKEGGGGKKGKHKTFEKMKLREGKKEWKRKIYGDEEQYNINKVYVCCPADLVEAIAPKKNIKKMKRKKGCKLYVEELLDTLPLSRRLMRFSLFREATVNEVSNQSTLRMLVMTPRPESSITCAIASFFSSFNILILSLH